MARNLKKYSDIKGGMDRGSRDHKSKLADKDGEIMKVASKKVIATHPSNTIKNAASLMRDNDVRRLPVLDAGTARLEGLATAVDVLDFMGGGEKYNIIEKDYGGNFLSAINTPISKIMRESQYLDRRSSVEEVVDIMVDKKTSCIPVVEDDEDLSVIALVTERDVLPMAGEFGVPVSEVMNSKPITASEGMMLSDVSKVMVRNQVRRLPVIKEGSLAGVVTVFDVLGYLERGEYKGVDAEENLSTRVEEIMASEVLALRPEEDLGEAVKLIGTSGYGGFPVAEDGSLKGIITITDILRWVYREKG
ncbi:MAG: CBS domain-containing protein [Candidatus Altiarchaeales archaeon]|nr:CBS domain-containing protein [Candidatus Altiarchaeales archaeon]MBD3415780.1 CBS domain-containing protein [Candidatus Altiarchaeales archaeon]